MIVDKISWTEYTKAIDFLAQAIQKSGKTYYAVFGIPRGGLIVATCISHSLDIPVITNLEASVIYANKNILICDDIVDSGRSMDRFRNTTFDTASVYYKNRSMFKPTYHGLNVSDSVWVVFPYERETDNVSNARREEYSTLS